MIAAGDADIVVAGGMESMTNAPYIADGARSGFRYGNAELADAIIKDGLWCAFDACLMGLGTDRYTGGSITREEQDDCVGPVARACGGGDQGRSPRPTRSWRSTVPQRKGDPILVEHDEGVRPGTTIESLGGAEAGVRRRTAPSPPATRHSSPTVAAPSCSCPEPRRSGVASRRSVSSSPTAWSPGPTTRRSSTSRAGRSSKAAEKAGLAVVRHRPVRVQRGVRRRRHRIGAELGISDEVVNVNGGAIALGHPIGMSGNRLALHDAARAAPSRWRHRRRGPVRRRWSGRRRHPALPSDVERHAIARC